ncbi:rho beta-crystallin [Morococcus cerebrosus]|uniref:Rho beta-crystallin n=1 Tax=Morococcus cerebrosus TaxID=1056807 RepID=A0A0C1HEU2_9NEIS|nr:rho beta-crystallin [Morococcus cerebrosus]
MKGEFGYWMTSILPPVFGSGKWRIIAKRSSENFQTTFCVVET